MGCRKNKYNVAYASDIKKILFAWLVSLLWLSVLTPMVLADETSISVTFDPDGGIDIDVSPKTNAFGSVQAGSYKKTEGSYFTIYNNGTVPMNTQFRTNATTANLTLDNDGSPVEDSYSLRTIGLDADNYITNAYATALDSALAADATKGFDINLTLGPTLTKNFTLQQTTIYIQGSISS